MRVCAASGIPTVGGPGSRWTATCHTWVHSVHDVFCFQTLQHRLFRPFVKRSLKRSQTVRLGSDLGKHRVKWSSVRSRSPWSVPRGESDEQAGERFGLKPPGPTTGQPAGPRTAGACPPEICGGHALVQTCGRPSPQTRTLHGRHFPSHSALPWRAWDTLHPFRSDIPGILAIVPCTVSVPLACHHLVHVVGCLGHLLLLPL